MPLTLFTKYPRIGPLEDLWGIASLFGAATLAASMCTRERIRALATPSTIAAASAASVPASPGFTVIKIDQHDEQRDASVLSITVNSGLSRMSRTAGVIDPAACATW